MTYHFSKKEILKGLSISIVTIILMAELFYGSVIYAVLLCPYVLFYFKNWRRELIRQQKWLLNLQFGEALRAISAALEAGYSVENTIGEAIKDLQNSYSKTDMIMRELLIIDNRLRSNVPIEEMFESLAKRSGLEDIASFASVFSITKRTGGNLIDFIKTTYRLIQTRIDLARDIELATAQKLYELKIMEAIPLLIVAYLRFFSPEMIAPLYADVFGRVFATIVLACYLGAVLMAKRMMRIEL